MSALVTKQSSIRSALACSNKNSKTPAYLCYCAVTTAGRPGPPGPASQPGPGPVALGQSRWHSHSAALGPVGKLIGGTPRSTGQQWPVTLTDIGPGGRPEWLGFLVWIFFNINHTLVARADFPRFDVHHIAEVCFSRFWFFQNIYLTLAFWTGAYISRMF
jgi:hypothetical protein